MKNNKYVIKARYVADAWGLIAVKGNVKLFGSKKEATEYGRSRLEGLSYLAAWEVISRQTAKTIGFDIK